MADGEPPQPPPPPPEEVIKQFVAGLKLQGFSMRVFKWDHIFSPDKESTIAPVWIRIVYLIMCPSFTCASLEC
ncbi:hypothetical protein LIER_41366 [Lithospermum erythrorhizon]|uniref:Uncharacterized protein n=1 Tax=Lithospermum erythrorhizon TaxID=34254 RepID=A0AAV3R8A4_LITER